ncbi:MAG: hypothetical protein WCI18_01280 [Pseudomonadota bacterium]
MNQMEGHLMVVHLLMIVGTCGCQSLPEWLFPHDTRESKERDWKSLTEINQHRAERARGRSAKIVTFERVMLEES